MRRLFSRPALLPVALLPIALVGCGGGATRPEPATAQRPAGPKFVDLAAAKKARSDGEAVVTLAVFSPVAPPAEDRARTAESERLLARVDQTWAKPDGALAGPIATVGKRPPLVIVPSRMDPELLNVAALEAGPHADAINGARTATFVRYSGPALPDAAHLRAAEIAAAVVARDIGGVVADLGTYRVWTGDAIEARLDRPEWLADAVTVDALAADDGVTFISRGMAKLALPDVEMSGVNTLHAKLAFEAFQRVLNDIRGGAEAAPGTVVAGVTLAACRRPDWAYDGRCVRVPEK